MISCAFLRLLRKQQKRRSASRIIKAKPPITPPTIAPTGALLDFEVSDEPVGSASAGGST